MTAPSPKPLVGSEMQSDASSLTQDIVPLGYMVVDLAAFVDAIDRQAKANLGDVVTLRSAGARISAAIGVVNTGILDLARTTMETERAAAGRLGSIAENTSRFKRMAEWGTEISSRTYDLERVLKDIVASNGQIARIARQVNILAVNASIEAARAGDAGRGFAIVAEAINELSRKTAEAASGVSNSIRSLDDWTAKMRKDAEQCAPDFEKGVAGAMDTRRVVEIIAADMTRARDRILELEQTMNALDTDNLAAQPIYDAIEHSAREAARGVSEAHTRSDKMMDACETLLQRAAEVDPGGPESRYIAFADQTARRISAAIEDGVRRGRISLRDLFDFSYREITGSDPKQHDAPFATFMDQTIQDILEEALAFDPSVAFCCACDRNGYIPTHNLKFSHAPRQDPAWNNAHCRNRRIFSDRAGRKAGANRAPFLMQVYRRDMGSEGFVMMKDISVPIIVNGRHWGGLRLGYRGISRR
ncbi:MAG: methyl-accepting chemotaxis protein [Jannaschia sp.]